METEDAAMESFGDDALSDELLEELLADVARCHASLNLQQPLSTLPSHATNSVSDSRDEWSSSASVDPESEDSKSPPTKRKRIRNNRPKEELDGLRRAAADLENLLALARQRRRTGRVTPMLMTDQTNMSECTPKEARWMGVATRQYKLLRESQIQNEHLRAQIGNQMQIIRGFLRLVERAQLGLPSQSIPRGLLDSSATTVSSKRKELLGILAAMEESIDDVFAREPFESSTDELSEISSSRFKDNVILPGARWASSSSRRYAPQSVAEVSAHLWAYKLPKTRPLGSFIAESFEQTEDVHSFHGTTRYSPKGDMNIMLIRRTRVWSESRRSIVSACSLWPNPSNASPWNAVQPMSKRWIDVRESMPSVDEALVEVRSHADLFGMQDVAVVMPPADARTLEEYIYNTMTYSINDLHGKLDCMLLGSSGEVFLTL